MRRASRSVRALAPAVAALAALAVAGCEDGGGDTGTSTPTPASTATGPVPRPPASLTRQKPDWRPCPAPTPLEGDTGSGPPKPLDGTPWECARIAVPLDYATPRGPDDRPRPIRAKADPEDGDRRLGSLVFNFGGPGASGVATLPPFAKEDYRSLHRHYDLVSFDPRGVGASAPVRCLDDRQLDAWNAAGLHAGRPGGAAGVPGRPAPPGPRPASGAPAGNCPSSARSPRPATWTCCGRSSARQAELLRRLLRDGTRRRLRPPVPEERRAGPSSTRSSTPARTPSRDRLGQAARLPARAGQLPRGLRQGQDVPGPRQSGEGRRGGQGAAATGIGERPLPDRRRAQTHRDAWPLNGIFQALYSKELWPALQQGLQEAEASSAPATSCCCSPTR